MVNATILTKITAWAEREPHVHAALLTGSLAGRGPKDDLSDYDVALFVDDIAHYANNDAWLSAFGTVIVCEPCELQQNDTMYPTRLVIYEGGLQIDFALFDVAYLKQLARLAKLPVQYNLGYQVLLDKDGITRTMQPANYVYPPALPPTKEEFELAVRIFFFEAFKAGKMLARNDLWHAKLRDWTTKEYLLTMIEWYEKSLHGWDYDTNYHGKRMQSWIEPALWDKAHAAFGHFDAQDSWPAFFATIELFREVAMVTAERLGYDYPRNIDDGVTGLLKELRQR